MTKFLDEREQQMPFFLTLARFSTASHNIIVCTLGSCDLDGQTTRWVDKWLNCWAQSIAVNKSSFT